MENEEKNEQLNTYFYCATGEISDNNQATISGILKTILEGQEAFNELKENIRNSNNFKNIFVVTAFNKI